MAVAYQGSSSVYAGSTATIATPKPTVTDGSVVVLCYAFRASSTVTTPPSGFSPIAGATGASGSSTASQVRVASYWKHVASAAGEPATYDLVASANTFGCGFAMSFTGADTADPIDVATILADTGSNNAVDSPTADATVADTRVLRGVFMSHATDGFASNAFTATDADRVQSPAVGAGTDHVGGAIAHEAGPVSPGATGAEGWTVGGTSWGSAMGVTIAIQGEHLTATAGDNQTVTPGTAVTLDGNATVGATTLEWSQLSGSSVMAYAVKGSGTLAFFAPKAAVGTDLVFRLTASNGTISGTDDVTVSVVAESVALGIGVYEIGPDGQPL